VGKKIRDHFLRIDARSLGLFRIAFALVLMGDLFRRWGWVRELYSNEGVLPNHNHLFNLRDTGRVWSFLHAFSTPGENHFAFVLILLAYLFFLLGYKTRLFHALSLLCLVSLGSRNILLENAGNYAAVALLFFTLFLPLGSRFSIDALARSMRAPDEKDAGALNDGTRVTEAEIEATRAPGWSPVSLAALAVTLQIVLILVSSALWHRGAGPWRDGSAIHYGLWVERWASDLGAMARVGAPAGLFRGLTWLLFAAEWAVPLLVLIPVARRVTRGLATGLLAIYGLAIALLFSLGLYGWTLVAAAALLIPDESWDAFARRFSPSRVRTVIYDADCGVCLWTARLLKRLDAHRHLAFQGNDDLDGLWRTEAGGNVVRKELPAAVTPELVAGTVVAVDAQGHVTTRGRAVAEIIRALPLGSLPSALMRLPGVSGLLDALYDRFAARRMNISVAVGMDACGIPQREPVDGVEIEAPADEVPRVVRLRRLVSGSVREVGVAFLFVAALAQTTRENPLPFSIPQPRPFAAAVAWPRMLSRWDVLVPPPGEDGAFVIDGQNKKGASVDPLTGEEPVFEPEQIANRRLGQLWNDYLYRIHLKEWEPYQKAFRDYLVKGGPALEGRPTDEQLAGFDAYWVKYTIAPPGAAPARAAVARDKLFTHSRGGRLGVDRLPILRPGLRRQE
jgi:predicted DCC family thiol-disulfide oxidoreductase YuxK